MRREEKILRLDLQKGDWTEALTQTPRVIEGYAATGERDLCGWVGRGPSELDVLFFGGSGTSVRLPAVSACIDGVAEGDELLFKQTTFVIPYVWSKLDLPGFAAAGDEDDWDVAVSFDDVKWCGSIAKFRDGRTCDEYHSAKRDSSWMEQSDAAAGYGGYGIACRLI